MKYFVKNQYGQVSIQDWDTDMSSNSKFKALTEEQLSYLESHPNASVYDVQNLIEPVEPTPPTPRPIEEVKAEALKEVSAYSLKTIDRFCNTYQYANAQVSLSAADGEGIYSHEEAQRYLDAYRVVGKKCRQEYYSVKAAIEAATSETSIETIKTLAYEYYDNITAD